MNGEIFIESEPGKGSVFTVCLPQGRIGPKVLGKEMTENLHQFRTSSRAQMKRVQISREPMPYGSVLIVDDVETNIYVAKGLITPYELKVDSADSGFEAISLIEKGNIYDVIFMDHMMPKMDGIETVKNLRDMGYTHTIIALTANALLGQEEVFLENGFDDFISKPIDSYELDQHMFKYIRSKKPPDAAEQAKPRQDGFSPQGPVPAQGAAPVQRGTPAQGGVGSSEIEELFVLDAEEALSTLESLFANLYDLDDSELKKFITVVHGVKSILVFVNEHELSDLALTIERSAIDRDFETVARETPLFLDSLRNVIGRLKNR